MPVNFDWKNPDYTTEMAGRLARLHFIRANWAAVQPGLWVHYRENPWDFIDDWGCTFDPRNVERGLPAFVPFKLFSKQREWCQWVIDRWKAQEPGLTEKTRDMGMSWLSVALACTLCIFRQDMAVGFGSRKEEYVDRAGHPKSLFWKARLFMANLPPEFRAGWSEATSPHMRIGFPQTGSVITGEAGDNIGRGDRAGIYFVDEAAFLSRPELIEASLSQTTNCRQDISSANGPANPFYAKRVSGKVKVFTFHWRDDPRKDDAWYEKQKAELDPVVVAQEVDIDYLASVTGQVIPAKWIQSAVGAFELLGIAPKGAKRGALDVADEGPDLNALAVGHGTLVKSVTVRSGAGSDIAATVAWAVGEMDEHHLDELFYDADGMGANVRGDARVLNEARTARNQRTVKVTPWRGSGEVMFKDRAIPDAAPDNAPTRDKTARTNGDYFKNAKAQAWFDLRARFQRTHRAVEAFKADPTVALAWGPDRLISLAPDMEGLTSLVAELAQATYSLNGAGQVIVDKAPDGNRSPNRADSVVILLAPRKSGFVFMA